jgi:hypothetical protein
MKKITLLLSLFLLTFFYTDAQSTIITRVWDDANANGRQDAGEPGINGVKVELKRPGGAVVATATTSNVNAQDGIVEFTTNEPSVKLKFYLKDDSRYAYTYKDVNSNNKDNIDSDARRNNGETDVFAPSGTVTVWDCGQWSPGSVIARVWDDRDANGRQDNGEPGISGVKVTLKRGGGTPILDVVTNSSGDAVFSSVVPADRDVKLDFDLKDSDHAYTLKDVNSNNKDHIDSDARRNNGETDVFRTTGSALPVFNFDCGQWSPGTVVARVWDDLNANGRQDEGEPGIEGVNVTLKRSGGTPITNVPTDANGDATFAAVVPADTDVKLDFDLKNTNHAYTLKDVNSNNKDHIDSDARRNNGETDVFRTTGAGLTVDQFDCGQWSEGTIEAFVWDDLNGNGRQDEGEDGIEDVVVTLKKSGGSVITFVKTNPDGIALFEKVVPADKDVKLDFSLKDSDHAFTYRDVNSNNKDHIDSDARRNNGETDVFRTTGADLVQKNMDCGQWSPGEIYTFVWDDVNGNGRQDAGEWGVPNVKVEVKRSGGAVQTFAYTDAKGIATLKDVPADKDFKLDYHVPSFASGFTLRDANSNNKDHIDSDPRLNNGETDVFRTVRGSAGSGQLSFDITSLDAGLTGLDYTADTDGDGIPDFLDKYPTDSNNGGQGTILTFVWDDLDADGRQDGGEPGIECAQVDVIKPGGALIEESYTHPFNGLVAFFDIVPGTEVRLKYYKKDANHAFTLKDATNNNFDSDADRSSGATGKFKVNGLIKHWDAGQWSPGSVEAFVWDDLDADGRQDTGEPGIEGVQVDLIKPGGALIATMNTNADGIAFFDAKVPADQEVRLKFYKKDVNHAFTLKDATNNNFDSDADRSSGETAKFKTTGAALTVKHVDAGQWSPGTVEAFVWDDLDGDGRQDGGEPGIAGVQVDLIKPGGAFIATATTGIDGIAKFNAEVPADQEVRLKFYKVDANHAFTLKDATNNNFDSDADRSSGETAKFKTTGAALTVTHVDAGQWSPGSVEAFVWDDLDADGRQDGDEPGMEGVTVDLIKPGGALIISTTTDGNGIANFDAVVPADQEVRLKFYKKDANHAFTLKDATNNNFDSDADRSSGETAKFKTTGAALTVTHVDAGQWSPGTIETYVWDDLDGDGRQDGDESGIKGVKVHLIKPGGAFIAEVFTDENGIALFDKASPADQEVRLKFFKPDGDHAFTHKDATNNNFDSDADRSSGETAKFKTTGAGITIKNVDAGLWTPGEIITYIWDDMDEDGRQDGGEWGVPNVTVEVRKPGGALVTSAVSGVDGIATLKDVPADQEFRLHYIKPGFASGITAKDKTNNNFDSDADPNNGQTAKFRTVRGNAGGNQLAFDIKSLDMGLTGVDYTQDTDNDGIPDFQDKYPTDNTNNGAPAIYSYAWDDLDGNGKQNDGQTGIGGVPTQLRRGGSNNVLQTSSTHPANGHVAFFDVPASTVVYLDFDAPTNHAFTKKNEGSNDNIDSDVDRGNGRTFSFSATGSTVVTKWDAGLWGPGTIQAYVWDDTDGNGKQNENPATPVKDITVKLRRAGSNNVLQTKKTKGNGIVTFENVPADVNVYLDFDLPNGYAFTKQDEGSNNAIDSDADRGNGRTGSFKTTKGSHLITDVDAGVWAPGTVQAYVWDDTDGNGKQNEGTSTPVKDITVKLRRAGSNSVLGTATTDANGIATLPNVPADVNVYLDFDLPNGYAFTKQDEGSNNSIDSDADRGNGRTGSFKTTKGSHLITDVDAGVWAPGEIQAYVWDDTDGNGKQNEGTSADVENITVKLRRAGSNNVLGTATTDANGIATLPNVPADVNVYLDFDLPAGYAFTLKDEGSNNDVDSDADRGNGYTASFKTNRGSHLITSVDAGVWAPGEIQAYVWDDTDGNGKQNEGSSADVENITVKLRRAGSNNVLGTATTDANGIATLPNVPADVNVYLDFDLPTGYAFTLQDEGSNNAIDSDADRGNGYTASFKTNRGSHVITSVDAGVWAPGSIETTVWIDANGDGKQNDGSSNVKEGVSVKLRRAGSNNVLQSTTTGIDGVATFTNVPADVNVYLDFDAPSGYAFTVKDAGSNNNIDSDADTGNGYTATFKLTEGSQNITSVDAGLITTGASLVTLPNNTEQSTAKLSVSELKLYPVPARTVLNVELNIDTETEARFQIIDINGRLIREGDWGLVEGFNKMDMDVTQLASGRYYLIVANKDMRLNKAFTVVK